MAFIISSNLIIESYLTFWMLFFITIRVSNSLDPDQARRFVGPDLVGPDLDPNCLQRLSADKKLPLG